MEPKLKLIATDNQTLIELDGKTMGFGVTSVEYRHSKADGAPHLKLDIDLEQFEFMEDGKFKEVEAHLDKQVAAPDGGHGDDQDL